MPHVQKLTVKGYKSIKSLVGFELRALNVLIGANGAGKSNFLSLFRFLSSLVGDNFQLDVQKAGGPNALLYFGSKVTPQMDLELQFSPKQGKDTAFENSYGLSLAATQDGRLVFAREQVSVRGDFDRSYELGSGHELAKLRTDRDSASAKVSRYVREKMGSWRQYHFHDTGDLSPMKARHGINDNLRLKPDGSNLAAYLRELNLHYEDSYRRVVETVRRVAPFFGDFVFRDDASETIQLEWTERGMPDTPWKANALSDGTLRFICLATLLQQPDWQKPDTILIDEPELGLHPFAINLLADMLKEAAESKQVIVSTQSVELLNAFTAEDVIVVQREQEETTFKRLNSNDLSDWLVDDYSLGDLWKRNILGGRPSR